MIKTTHGERGLVAVEVKMTQHVRSEDLYTGPRRRHDAGIEIVPAEDAIRGLDQMIG